jgi:Glycosyl hydrolases family 11
MKYTTLVTSALRRARPQCLLLAGLVVASVTGLQAQTITSNKTGTNNGYYYSYWRSGGSATMTLGSGGNYSLTWNSGNTVAGKGWNPGGSRTVGYNCGVFSASGWTRFAVYGWTTSPLIEYYIVEKWAGSGNSSGGSTVGTVSSDGGTYNVSKHQQVNQPSIQGTQTFWQYFSVRQSQNSTGANHSVTTGNHFTKWKSALGSMGTHNYMILATEGYNSSGSTNATVW